MKTAGWSTSRVTGQVDRSEKTTRLEDRRIVRQTLVDPTVTRSTIRADVGVAIVPQTISRHLAEANLKSKRPFRALPLTPEHRQLSLQWCQVRSMWNHTDWQKVVFSDESRFVLGTDDNRVRVWRRPGERYNSPHTVVRHTARTAGVMVWGAIAYDSRSTLFVMLGTGTGQRYVDDILRPHLAAMNSLQTNYQALVSDEIEGPHESVIFHVASEDSVPRWNHVDDLDAFFRRIYRYHQNGGYACIMLYYSIGGLMYFIIGSSFIYGINCIHFNFDQPPSPYHNTTVTSLSQLFIPVSQCVAENFGVIDWFLVILFILGLVYRVYKCIDRNCKAREIRQFFELNMKIPKCDLPNITWHEIVNNLRSVQHEQQMCVNNTDLNELDISHRILRTTNYMVAMVNKSILPLKLNIWFLGDWVYLSSQLRQTLVFLLFTSSFMSPFKAPGKLKEEFKKREERLNCANHGSKSPSSSEETVSAIDICGKGHGFSQTSFLFCVALPFLTM
ncbi:autophagy-related protein 9A [Trichonephila clavipes]|nr:autophagy-related protein 9A [Trichonephila clavipes]